MKGKICYNCSIDETPVWRQARDLGVTLCNACHICWTTKGHHRAKPSPEELARTKASAHSRKAAPMAQANVDAGGRSGSTVTGVIVGGKRKRVAKDFGEDQECYGEGILGRSDSADSMDWEISVQTHAARFDAAPEEDKLTTYGAAKVLGSLKKAKITHQLSDGESDLSAGRASRRTATRRAHSSAEPSASDESTQRQRRRSRAASNPSKPPKVCVNCRVTETPVWRKVDGEYPLCNACGVAKQQHGVHRIPPCAAPAPAPLPIFTAAPAPPLLAVEPPLRVPVFKPLARTLPTDFNPFRVDSPTPAMRMPMPACSPCRGVSLFGGPGKAFAL